MNISHKLITTDVGDTFTGVHVTFFPADFARQVANMLLTEAGGIVLPTGPVLLGGPS